MVRRLLAEDGLLMQADPALPSVTTLVAGKPIEGSWWGHASGRAIFAVCEALDDDPDVLATRLVNGKVTFVHRRLWSSLLAMATSGEGWQLDGLSREAKLVKLADKISNLRDVAASPPPDWPLERQREYFEWARRVVDRMRGAHARLENLFDEAYLRRP